MQMVYAKMGKQGKTNPATRAATRGTRLRNASSTLACHDCDQIVPCALQTQPTKMSPRR